MNTVLSHREFFDPHIVFLEDLSNLNDETWVHDGVTIPIQTYRYQGYKIWGATQRMIQNLLEILEQKS